MKALTLPAPAKLNLFLHIVGRRADGYHQLQTLFQLIDRCDEVDIELHAEGVPGAYLQPGSDGPAIGNLAVRAAELLLRAVSASSPVANTAHVRIGLRKRVPQGGLGGGSSDAATVLLGLNHLLGAPLTMDELAALGVGLGADVPVFVRGQNAWAEGIGDRLFPIDVPPAWYLVIAPGCEVSTAQVFGHVALTRNSPLIRMRGSLESGVRNDCESLVRRLYPEVDRALDWLSARAPARLTGTGGCVFATFHSQEDAARAGVGLPAPWQAFVAKGLDHSPVHDLLR